MWCRIKAEPCGWASLCQFVRPWPGYTPQRDGLFEVPQLVLGQCARRLGVQLRRWGPVVGQQAYRGRVSGIEVPGGRGAWVHVPCSDESSNLWPLDDEGLPEWKEAPPTNLFDVLRRERKVANPIRVAGSNSHVSPRPLPLGSSALARCAALHPPNRHPSSCPGRASREGLRVSRYSPWCLLRNLGWCRADQIHILVRPKPLQVLDSNSTSIDIDDDIPACARDGVLGMDGSVSPHDRHS